MLASGAGVMARRAEGCASCIILSQRVDVLEGRVSVLHQIKEDEKFLDSLAVLSGVNNDITCPWLGDPTHGEPEIGSKVWGRLRRRVALLTGLHWSCWLNGAIVRWSRMGGLLARILLRGGRDHGVVVHLYIQEINLQLL
ncbi:hypothetical protein DPEC_G00201300 [Dallia pectoralis]|uniref:Uncharacterized protein n=1 Tax=Dallia pectoralis TaxID=75939 RepID=A0ACC2G996_DALPE|nr:hypothetical protein DPEC_G00201300 [Dallia pectoralis]